MLDLAERVRRTEGVVAKYRHKPFAWRERRTCVHLARTQMRAMGHQPPPIPDIRSARGAMTALRKQGHDTLESLLDSMLPRIAVLEMWPGDLAMVPGEPPFEALAIYAGGGTLLMYHAEAEGLVNVKQAVGQVTAAWRV